MTEIAVTHSVSREELDPSAVLREAWRLYKRLFTRSVLMGAIVFSAVQLVRQLALAEKSALLVLVWLLLVFVGSAILQGGFVEIVRGLHVNGDDEISVAAAFQRTGGKLVKLLCLSVFIGLGVGLASILFVIPGLVLWTRWAIAVPVAMLEEGSARDALRRSRAIIDGNGWNVFKVLLACGVVNFLIILPFTLIGDRLGPIGVWVAASAAWALAAPFTAHALIVVYYALLTPGRPVVLDPGKRWESVWTAQDETEPAQRSKSDSKLESIDEEYMRKYEERAKQWGD